MKQADRLRGSSVAVLGLGIEGRDLVRFLSRAGARVTAFDTRPAEQLGDAVVELERLGANLCLGPIDASAADGFEALYVSQSVLLDREPLVQRMRELGRPVSSMMREFLRRWPGPVVGITGSSGKTTTTALVAAAFETAGIPYILGGNIGRGLLVQLDAADAPDRSRTWAVLEVSHTQLQLTGRSPSVAAVTNVTPNHLDQFSWDEYVDLKRTLIRYQQAGDVAVLNAAEPVCASLRGDTPGRVIWFNRRSEAEDCYFVEAGVLVARRGQTERPLMPESAIPLRGAHNVENVLAAAAVSGAVGIADDVFAAAVRDFHAVPHRLEPVATVAGVTYVNDSIATAPERTLAGVRSFDEPLVLLLGGREKHLPLDELMTVAHARARAIVCFGEAAALLEAAAIRCAPGVNGATVLRVAGLAEAVAAAYATARAGDVVLLSPACTSFDAYPNFEKRGEAFRRLVNALISTPALADAPV